MGFSSPNKINYSLFLSKSKQYLIEEQMLKLITIYLFLELDMNISHHNLLITSYSWI